MKQKKVTNHLTIKPSLMKLKEYNTDNTVSLRSTTPRLTVNIKSGVFHFNPSACEMLDLESGDQIVIQQDEEDEDCFYLERVKEKGFVIRCSSSTNKGMVMNNTSLARTLAGPYDGGVSCKFLIAGKPTEFNKRKLWGLLKKATV